MRESSSRNSSAASSRSGQQHHHQFPPPMNHQHHNNNTMQHSMMNNNNNIDGGSSSSGSAGISSSSTSRSTARVAAAAAANNINVNGVVGNNNNMMMRMQQQGLTSTGSGTSSQDAAVAPVVAAAPSSGGGGINAAHFNNNFHHHPNSNNYYSSSAGAPSSQASASEMSSYMNNIMNNNNHHFTNNNNNNNNTHYSQYSSITYPGELTVYSWGRGEDGQLGIGDTSDQDEPTYVDALRGVGVKQIACGSGHTVVLTGEGEVYTWGRGDDGRLGHGDNGWKYVPRLTHSLTGQIITHVTCGSYHTAAVSSNGDLYTWGGGMYGKLGHGNESGHSNPRRVEALVGLSVIDIACGSRHTAVVTNKGCLYTWGDKENGVAGHGDTEGHQYTPKLLERLSGKKVVQLSACGFHTGCLTDQGECFTWGEVSD